MHDKFSYRLANIAVVLAVIVVILGAYTRLKDAGLGCPDWPGCYGHLVVPQTTQQLASAQHLYPQQPVEATKAWAEMVHRYVAGSLATLIALLFVRAWWRCREKNHVLLVPTLLLGLVIFQAALGMWTVTLKLHPPVVMLHLMGGMSLVALLSLLRLQLTPNLAIITSRSDLLFRWFALFGLLLLIIQIMLGAWTSTNYASLACHDFPSCHGQLIPPLDFAHAFNFSVAIGPNYQGGWLDNAARVTIHVMHRLGALIVFSYWSILLLTIIGICRSPLLFKLAKYILFILVIQVCLGISNVLLQLPLIIAVAHNGVAALLLASIVGLNYCLWRADTVAA